MGKIAVVLVAGVAIGLGFAFWQGVGAPVDNFGPGPVAGDRAAIERRISELETELKLERYERQLLADEIGALQSAALTSAAVLPTESDVQSNRATVRARDAVTERFPDGLPADRTEVERTLEQRQVERFVEAGFAPDRARSLLQREDELEMEVLRARYDARQDGASDEEIANMTVAGLMRQELGDADYEKYLAGQGRPTSISVREVLSNSPARAAGLRSGDEILSYNGKRVFEMNELSQLTEAARPGSTVVLDVERGGQRLQFYIEGGPLGISGGGRSRRDFEAGR